MQGRGLARASGPVSACRCPRAPGMLHPSTGRVGDSPREDDVALSGLVRLASLALESARLLREEQRARTGGRGRGSSARPSPTRAACWLPPRLDLKATLDTLARLSVPVMADWCFVDLEGRHGRGAAHVRGARDPGEDALAARVGLPPDPRAASTPPPGRGARRGVRWCATWTRPGCAACRWSDEHHDAMRDGLPLPALQAAVGPRPPAGRAHSPRCGLPAALCPGGPETAQDLAAARRAAGGQRLSRVSRGPLPGAPARRVPRVASHELKISFAHPGPAAPPVAAPADERGPVLVALASTVPAAGQAQRQVDKLAGLVDGLPDVSRLSSGGMTLQRERHGPEMLAREVKAHLALAATQAGSQGRLLRGDAAAVGTGCG